MTPKSKGQECPRCGSRDVLLQDTQGPNVSIYVCLDCDHEFQTGSSESKRRDERRHRRDSRHDRL